MSGSIRIRIGATKDRSVDIVFGQVEKRGEKAARVIQGHMNRALTGGSSGVRGALGGKTTGASGLDPATRSRMHALRVELTKQHSLENARHREKLRNIEKETRAQIQASRRAQEASARASYRERETFARRTSHRATRFLVPNAPLGSLAARGGMALSGFARGAGVEASLTGMVSRVREAEDLAIALSSKGFRKGEAGPAGTRVAPDVLLGEARALAKKYGAQGGSAGILAGQYEFVEQRGNLAGSRGLLEGLVKRAVATRTDMADVGKVAAKIDSMLATQGEYATNDSLRYEKVIEVVDNLMQQGKVGSIGFAELSEQIPKVSGLAANFEGDAAENLKQLTALMQLAERGPASNPAVAATMAKNFAMQISKNSDKIQSLGGVQVYNQAGKKKMPAQLAMELIANTEGGQYFGKGKNRRHLAQEEVLNKILPNIRGNLALQELMNVFTGAGGGAAGMKAMQAEFGDEKFGGQYKQLDEDLQQSMDSMSNQSERFNSELEDITQELARELVPALKEAAPEIIKLMRAMGDLVGWIANNPGEAIARAIELSILRAGIESALRTALERAIMGRAGSGGAATGGAALLATGGKNATLFGKIAGAAMVTALLMELHTVGRALIDWGLGELKGGQKKQVSDVLSLDEELAGWRAKAASGGLTDKDRSSILAAQTDLMARSVRASSRAEDGTAENMFYDLGRLLTGSASAEDIGREQVDATQLASMEKQISEMNKLLRGKLTVTVANMPEKGMGPNEAGRASPPMPGN